MVNLLCILILLFNKINLYNNSFLKNEKQNYLKFQFNTKIKSISKVKLDSIYNEKNFLNDFLNNTIFINLNMGTPLQNVKLILDPYEKCFTFNKNNKLLNYNLQKNNISNIIEITTYNKNISVTVEKSKENYNYFNNEYEELCEDFYLYQYNDFINKTNDNTNSTISLNFLFENKKTEEEIVYGKIGLNMNNKQDINCPRFIYSLKNKNILDKYIWHFDFYSHFHGFFYLGPEPHFYNIKNNKNAIYKDYQYIKLNAIVSTNGNNVEWNILFNQILYKNISNNYIFYLNDKKAQIDINLGLIIGTNEYQKIIEKNFFNFLIKFSMLK